MVINLFNFIKVFLISSGKTKLSTSSCAKINCLSLRNDNPCCSSLIKHSRVQQTASEHLFVMGFSTTEESLLSSSSSIIFELVIVRRIHLLNSRKVSRGGSMFVFHLYKAHRPLTPLLLYYAKYLSQSRDYSSAS